MADNPLIVLEGVEKSYILGDGREYRALHDIHFKIARGEFVAIMGPSGSGKSTLMHILGALDLPSAGTYLFENKDITQYSRDELSWIRNRKIGFVFQSFNLLPRRTVLQNVAQPMIYAGIKTQERHRRAIKALSIVQIADKSDQLSSKISGGEIQRVAIARALVMNPPLILADEPTGNLDTKTAHEIMSFIKDQNAKGTTVVVITHEDDIASYAHRIIRLTDGRIVSDTTI